MSHERPASRILLIGKPNSGKSLLFNRITGMNQKVANFPGVTVEVKSGMAGPYECFDLPGLYSLRAISEDERVAAAQFHSALSDQTHSVMVCVLDATRLERSLVLGLEVQIEAQTAGVPCLFALNMTDELKKLGLEIDTEGLGKELGTEVIPISARTREGLDRLQKAIEDRLASDTKPHEAHWGVSESSDMPSRAKSLAQKFSPSSEKILAKQSNMDRFFLHEIFGFVTFVAIMAVLFQSVFTWASPFSDAVEAVLGLFGKSIESLLPAGIVSDLVKDGLIAGISGVLVFIPQIFFLSFLIGILEDSGYLARAAMICHRPLHSVGLSGKSFVPLLSGHACAIPAVMAARTIESPRARWLTWMAIPLMSCSARLPVYGLLIAAVIPPKFYFGGLLGLQGLTLLALYGFGIFCGLLVAALTNRFVPESKLQSMPFVLELPPYRFPVWKALFLRSFTTSKSFVSRAGPTIFAVSLVVWVLGYFPHGAGHLDSSYLANLGQMVAPIFAPLGVDWKITVAILSSFLAREVFVGTLGVLLGMESLEDNAASAAMRLHEAGITLANGIALMVLFAISLQCVSTLAILKKESGSRRLPITLVLAYGVAAYVLALVTYRIALLWN